MRPMRPMTVDWVASSPVPVRPYRRRVLPVRYQGPPSYPVPPRWGFPALTWRYPTTHPGADAAVEPAVRMRAVAATAVPMLWVTAAAALIAAGAEVWRYVLLLISRTQVLSQSTLHVSDSLVITGGVMALVTAAMAVVGTLLWVVRARQTAAVATGLHPARPNWQVVVGLLVPGANLSMPGSVLAELEHAALERPALERPQPSRLLRVWWLVWVLSLVLAAVTLLWGLRSGVTVRANGVLLHAWTDLAAAAVAVLTAKVVRQYTTLLMPTDTANAHRSLVVKIVDPEPAVLTRRPRPANSPR